MLLRLNGLKYPWKLLQQQRGSQIHFKPQFCNERFNNRLSYDGQVSNFGHIVYDFMSNVVFLFFMDIK